jgi:hypothetical protein
MGSVGVQVAVLAGLILGFVVIGYMVLTRQKGGQAETRGSALLEWFGLTALTLLLGGVLLFPAAFILLFWLGNPGGMLGLALIGVYFVAVPIIWAIVIRRRMRHEPQS